MAVVVMERFFKLRWLGSFRLEKLFEAENWKSGSTTADESWCRALNWSSRKTSDELRIGPAEMKADGGAAGDFPCHWINGIYRVCQCIRLKTMTNINNRLNIPRCFLRSIFLETREIFAIGRSRKSVKIIIGILIACWIVDSFLGISIAFKMGFNMHICSFVSTNSKFTGNLSDFCDMFQLMLYVDTDLATMEMSELQRSTFERIAEQMLTKLGEQTLTAITAADVVEYRLRLVKTFFMDIQQSNEQ